MNVTIMRPSVVNAPDRETWAATEAATEAATWAATWAADENLPEVT